MVNGKITEAGIKQAYQSCSCFTDEGTAAIPDSGTLDEVVWYFSNTGLPLYTASQREQRPDSYSRSFRGFYSQTTTQPDQGGKAVCKVQGDAGQQSSPYCAGRIFSKGRSWQKRRDKLRYHLPMIVCGSKNSLRPFISLFQSTARMFPLNIPLMN